MVDAINDYLSKPKEKDQKVVSFDILRVAQTFRHNVSDGAGRLSRCDCDILLKRKTVASGNFTVRNDLKKCHERLLVAI